MSFRTLLVVSASLMLLACSHESSRPHLHEYQQALSDFPAAPVEQQTVEKFADVFDSLGTDDLAELEKLIDERYAEEFFFNDTFRTIYQRDELKSYMRETSQMLINCEVGIDDIAHSGDDVYVRWTMRMQFSVMGREVDSESTGLSHLRYNDDGKIILQQDFWDGVEGFYQHLPVIGLWLQQIRSKL